MIPTAHATAVIALVALLGTQVPAPGPVPASGQGESKPSQAEPKHTIEELGFLAGSWEIAGEKSSTDENWTHPAGGAMLGNSRTIKAGKMSFFEFLRIETRNDQLYYMAQPGGGSGTVFALAELKGNHAVFENKKHDFPKKISYRLEADGVTLVARIEGDGTESEKPQDFRFKRRTAR